MIRGVFLPATGTLHAQLRTRIARDAIARGMGLYTDGVPGQVAGETNPTLSGGRYPLWNWAVSQQIDVELP